MDKIDKNQRVIEYLMQCPAIKDNPLFFNFINAKDNNKQFVTTGNDKSLNKPYIDGSVLKAYTFTIIDYKSVAYNAIVKQSGYPDENIEDLLDTQSIIDWIEEKDFYNEYPDFGEDCVIDKIEALTDNPKLNGVDTSIKPSLAKYSISVRITYLDRSKVLWK